MTSLNSIVRFASLAAALGCCTALSAEAAQSSARLTMKPLQGISFDFGSEHAIGYFLAENGTCKLVVSRAPASPDWDDEFVTFSASRFEATVPQEKATKYRASQGKALEFYCEPGASAMSVADIEVVASGQQR